MVTECERIIAEGIISADYLKEEVRCDFLVDTNRKKLWVILLDLLVKFDNVCKKHNLRYFLIGGTLLGAVRHNGFIPWDDDVDVAMPRKDYDILMGLSSEFKAPYFLQTPYTDPLSFFSYMKLRNSNTTMVHFPFRYQTMNQGVLIDIFPLDNVELDGIENRFNITKKLNMDNSTFMRMSDPRPNDANKKRISSYPGGNPLKRYEKIQSIASQFNSQETGYVGLSTCTIYDWQKMTFNCEDFASAILGEFEGFKFPIPVGSNRVLKTMYGDYMAFPPIEKRGTWHGDLIIDPDMPYVYYLCEDTVH